jgi:hypothetical protein
MSNKQTKEEKGATPHQTYTAPTKIIKLPKEKKQQQSPPNDTSSKQKKRKH